MTHMYDKRIKVITYAEVTGLVVVFATILYLLYPKTMLQKQVLSESSNYDLTATYLENMLRIDPTNKTLMYKLAETALKRGKIDLTLSLSQVLLNDASDQEKSRILQLQYKAYRQEYLYASKERRDKITPILKKLNQQISTFYLPSKEEQRYWFKEMFWLQAYPKALQIINEALKQEPQSLYWLNQQYELASRLHLQAQKKHALTQLLMLDKANKAYWLKQALALAKEESDPVQIAHYESQLKHLLPATSADQNIQEKIDQGLYIQAANLYMQRYHEAPNKTQKIHWLKSALLVLVTYGMPQERVRIIKEVESDFLDDPEMVEYFLTIYLESDHLKDAVALSKKVLDHNKMEDQQ